MNISRIAVAAFAVLFMSQGMAADTDSVPISIRLAAAKARIKAGNWPAAIQELKRVNDPSNADWNNLMGYSLRKSKTPDYAAAEKYYNAALRIDPGHRGALEYSGELYLILGNLPKAEERMATLDRMCAQPCEEQADLKQAIEDYKNQSGDKAAGNKEGATQ
jgi:tetratricopeptide (TPR) repeat protein